MKFAAFTSRRILSLMLLSLIIPAAIITAQVDSTPPRGQTVASAPSGGEASRAAALRVHGLELALTGQFEKGLDEINAACKLAPDDAVAAAAGKLLGDYITQLNRVRAERDTEYQQAVRRVQRAKLVEAFCKNPADANKVEQFRKVVSDSLVTAYNKCGNGDSFDGDKESIAKICENSVKALTECLDTLAKLNGMLKEEKGEYGETFRGILKTLEANFRESLALWKSPAVDTPAARREMGKKVHAVELVVQDIMADLDVMITEKPWRQALVQARLAKELAGDKEKFLHEKWLVDLMAEMDARGKKAIAEANWVDAQTVYFVLGELDDSREAFKATEKNVSRHVRVLGLYGKKPESKSASKPATQPRPDPLDDEDGSPAMEEDVPWQKFVEGADAGMVEAAIAQLSQNYVTNVDYRKVTRGALTAIKDLAETPQAASSFKSLSDKDKKAEFLDVVNRELDNIQKKDRVESVDLQLALNTILEASEKTVNIPTEVLVVEFADGFLEELDKFSAMIWPHEVADFEKQTMGHFFGVGVQIHKEPKEPLKVVEPLLNSPAFKAGIKAGDSILAVDGRKTNDLPVDKLMQMIMGPKGSKVVLQIKRRGLDKAMDIPLIRDQINITTVKGWQRFPTGEWDFFVDRKSKIVYVRLTQFTEQTAADIAEVLEAISQLGITSVILDLRFNPGGLLRSATAIADEFLTSGRIVSTSGRQVREQVMEATPSGHYQKGDLLVLVNQYSASAAEIVSGALKDWKRGLIVGQRTYGKGSVQNVIPISHNRARLKLTTQYYYLPSGRLLHRRNGDKDWGVNPDIEVLMTPRQTRIWLDIRRKTDLLQDVDQGVLKADLVDQYAADIQLETAVLLAKLRKLQDGKDDAQSVVKETAAVSK